MFILVACSNNDGDNSTNSNEKEEVNYSTQLSEEKITQIKKLEEKNAELQDTLNSIQTDFNYKKEEADYYKLLIEDIIKSYSNAQLKDLAIKLWDYELEINGVTVPTNGIVEIQENSIEVSLIEKQPDYPILPNEILIQGKISEDYTEHIKMNSNPTETYVTDGTVVTGIHHEFVDVDKDSTISFTVTDQLKKRLGLETSQITINKK